MPTGYTAGITGTTTLAEFAMSCARAFGALITMRDDPADAPIPEEFAPSPYHAEQLKVAKGRLAELEAMTPEQAAPLCAADHEAAMKSWREGCAEDAATAARYRRMLALVSAWEPPTKDHVGLRDFMVQQITESIRFDCHDREAPTLDSPEAWLAKRIESAKWNVNYHEEQGRKEVERARERTEWVRALRKSLEAA
jgi:hypothetical protein